MKTCYHSFMRIIAHRGWSAEYPENTLLSFSKAIEIGADGIELDVHLSKDGEVMVIHDEVLKRTTGMDGSVYEYDADELKEFDASFIKGGGIENCRIPSLEEVLRLIAPTKLILNIELKTYPVYYPGIESKVFALVKKYGMEERIIYSSFNWLSVFRMGQIAGEADYGLLTAQNPPIKNLGKEMRELGIRSYHPEYGLLSDDSVTEMKDNGRRINVWTVDDDEKIKKCIEWKVDGLITNDPEKAIRIYRNYTGA